MKKMFVFGALMFLIPSFCSAHWADSQIEVLQKNEILQEVFDVNEIEQILNRSITREEFFSLIAVADDIVESEPNKTFLDFN